MNWAFLLILGFSALAIVQDEPMVEIEGPGGQKISVPASKAAQLKARMAAGGFPGMPAQGGSVPGQPPGQAPGQPPGGPSGGPSTEKPAAKDDAAGDVTRAEKPPQPPDPKELEVRPDDDGKLAFSFRNQPWPALMEWLADVSQLPLDWQELPGGFVNLASPGRYTVAETRDLFNRHLLTRGFTMLELDGGLAVVKTENINPAIVPRVSTDQLDNLQPNSFVRTSLDCGWLLAGKLAEELKPLISGNGRLVALEQTNRLEAMDTAINLSQIASLIREEQTGQAREDLAREFELRYLPAEEAKRMLSAFLGIEDKSAAAANPAVSPQQMRQMQMMQQQMMQQGGGKQPGMPDTKKPEISIVTNNRRNSLLVNAPPDRLAIAAQFIKQVDVPGQSLQSLADVESRVQVLRLTSLNPERLAEIVGDMNILEPTTRLRVDKENKALIVSGSIADRYIIKSLADRLDGSARKFEVLQLRRLDAREVAESIQFLMGVEKEEDNSRSRRMMFGFFGGGQEETSKDRFRVAANVRYRQVLLWANESEMEEVRNLLVKLGELPPEGGSRRTTRLIEASTSLETLEYLRQLQKRFNATAPNQIILPSEDQFTAPQTGLLRGDDGDATEDAEGASPDGGDKQPAGKDNELPERNAGQQVDIYQLVTTGSPTQDKPASQDKPADRAGPPAPPRVESADDFDRLFAPENVSASDGQATAGSPIRIEIDAEGNLMISSEDTGALDRLENLMLEVAPPQKPYSVFTIRNATASWMRLNLLDYFEEEDDDSESGFPWMIFGLDDQSDDQPEGLGKQNSLRFVADNDTGTIVVIGATRSQLKTIGELIELWDVPEPVDRSVSRYTRLVTIKYSRAATVAETIKEAYRDLLSSNDKAFGGGGGQGGGRQPGAGGGGPGSGNQNEPRNRDSGGSNLVDADGGKESGQANFSFKGKLSIGVDPVGNTLLVSAEGPNLLELICEMIDQVDQAAQPQGAMEIRQLPGTVNPAALEMALRFLTPQGESSNDRQNPAGNGNAAAGRNDNPTPPMNQPANQRRPQNNGIVKPFGAAAIQ
ncbi:secretin N-terminal domain-containing protein [Planctomycetaceae bacterium SH139]